MKADKKESTERYLVPAVAQASQILFALADARSPHMSLIEICSEVGIHKSKAFSILFTLQKFGLVQKNSDGKGFALGPGLVTLSRRVLDNLNVPRLADPVLEKLANKAGGTAILGLIEGKGVFVAAKQEGNHDIGYTIRIGNRFPLTYGSHGKAIAAFLPPAELEKLLQQKKLYFYGESGSVNRQKLDKELAQIRRDGFALDIGEMRPGLNAAAAAVFGAGAKPVGYIVVIGIASEEAARQLGPAVAQAARGLSRRLGADMKLVASGE